MGYARFVTKIALMVVQDLNLSVILEDATVRNNKYRKHSSHKSDDVELSLLPNPASKNDTNLFQLNAIKKSEITMKKILGKGAFGTVYEGMWKPEGSNNQIPTAIKVLHENTMNTSIEFLNEALVMASMNHPNVLHLIAICISSEIMLLTQLMPKSLLNWCRQIAKGMAYLEEIHLVHKDLAARNVLLETPDTIKISDFGLSKFINGRINIKNLHNQILDSPILNKI